MPLERLGMVKPPRGWLGGFKGQITAAMLAESKTLEHFLASQGLTSIGESTLIDNCNAVSISTIESIQQAQLETEKLNGLDDFLRFTADSTNVKANSRFPTDSGGITALLSRVRPDFVVLDRTLGIPVRIKTSIDMTIAEIELLHKGIQLGCGGRQAKEKRKKKSTKKYTNLRKRPVHTYHTRLVAPKSK